MKKKVIIGLILANFTLLFLVGCGSMGSDDTADWAGDASVVREAAQSADVQLDSDDEISRLDRGEVEEEASIFGSRPMLLASESGRQLSYTVSLFIETEDFMESIRIIWEAVADLGGYAIHESIRGTSLHNPGRERTARFELRIPNEYLSEFLEIIEDHFNMVEYDNDLDDFTFTYERQTAQLDNLREQEEQLLADLEDDDADRDEIERDLASIQSQMRDLDESTTIIQRNVDYSDVSIRLDEVIIIVAEEPISLSFGERIQETLDGTLDILLMTIRVLLIVLVALLPWIVVIGLLTLLIVYVVKKFSKKEQKPNQPQNLEKPQNIDEQPPKNNPLFEKKPDSND